jgi:probable HAF family extracellular repeat protein
MKSILTSITATGLLAAVAMAQPQAPRPQPHYTVTDLGTFGGAYSFAYGIDNAGVVSGGAATPAQTNFLTQTGFVWYGGGPLIPLGTLGPPQFPACPSCSSEGAAPNLRGEVALISETSTYNGATGEDFCGFGTHHQCLAAIWQNGKLTALPTLAGGHNAQTYWINNQGQAVGLSENGVQDSTCATATPYQQFHFEPVIWGANGEIRQLDLPKGDTVAFGFGINDNGEAIGVSGLCSNTSAPPVSASSGAPRGVLWDRDGSPTDLGSLGGSPTFVVPSAINNRGEVGGTSRAKDGTLHPFLWTRQTGMRDLGTLSPGNPFTTIGCCNTLNDNGDAVAFTGDISFNLTALLWHNNVFTDLNTLIPTDSPLYLTFTSSINDSGQIVGLGIVKSSCPAATPPNWLVNQSACTEVHAFLATPGHP